MIRTAVYYQENDQDTRQNVIEYINSVIEKVKEDNKREITGVFIDTISDNSEFLEMIDLYINQIDQVILLTSLEGEFENELLNEIEDSGRIKFVTMKTINSDDDA